MATSGTIIYDVMRMAHTVAHARHALGRAGASPTLVV